MSNYFNKLSFRNKLAQLSKCRFVERAEFVGVIDILKKKKIVIIGCGSQGLNQGLNMRDSGLDISYVFRKESIFKKSKSYSEAIRNSFVVGSYEELIPKADVVINLTPDKQHSSVVQHIQPLMKYGSVLGYSHGFNIVEVGENIRKDITVVMVAPKSPGIEVREEYKKGFGVPTLIAVHEENDPQSEGIDIAKAWAVAIGGDRAGVLESSFTAEVKSDLMGEQTILCGMLQAGSLIWYDLLVADGVDPSYSGKLVQFGWEAITKSLKIGGITLMMDRLSNVAKLRAYSLSEQLKMILRPLFQRHMDDILSGKFSFEMMQDWDNSDKNLLDWRERIRKSPFENVLNYQSKIEEQEYYDKGIPMVSIVKAGVELAFDSMLSFGISEELAYYESLHELPLIANSIARKRLHGMNLVISDTAEYGGYLFSFAALSLLQDFTGILSIIDITKTINPEINEKINNFELYAANEAIRQHPIEKVGRRLRSYMNNSRE